ncbi:MAG: AAA family ATPase [Gammaproteobacteria bacterium]|uniref:Putative ATPase domain containing protein n=1 Tax=viral metagenome TaxID=1070528 RepID=A0A6M3KR74_9ZZZZ|nr:AAA family ATPase [Gammaproteobacteria bacterium]MBU1479298.1 AAA family ATPase [Gammaproteobacteria bacterium]MBU2002299.1 AAA family ATPase [Gammaproteobacteria bacterium]MBU2132172.1 AAA family ATPase [Gammaproteobacteria bacterium]MBU2189553.1 AAA family ATPase [Gammaproteobacteria bacterium]
MLKRFSVTNFSSFKDEQTFDLTAGKTTVLKEHYVEFRDVNILKSGVIYGANASGKSNLIKSIDFAKKIIVNGLSGINTYKKYFRLCENSAKEESSFEFEIEIDGEFFSYGFSAHLQRKEIVEEWLFEIKKSGEKLIFKREGSKVTLGPSLLISAVKSRFQIYSEDMRNQPSQLFLTEIASKELKIPTALVINKLFGWVKNKLVIIYPDDKFNGMKSIDKDLVKSLTKYLTKFDTGVVDIDSINEDFETGVKDLPADLKNKIENELLINGANEIIIHAMGINPEYLTIYKDTNGELKVRKLGLVHGKTIKETFELKDESDGTRRLLDFIPLISKFSQGFTILIDEFDRSLHPKLTREFFKLFYDVNANNSQLIVTTHESTLLDLKLLRRDEIWFVEKGSCDSSSLFSLNKFNERYDMKVEKAYLLGRYGAIPIFNDLDLDSGVEDGI